MCLLCPFQLFHYRPVVELLLQIIGIMADQEAFVLISLAIIDRMALGMDTMQKLIVGDLGTIEVRQFVVSGCLKYILFMYEAQVVYPSVYV